MIEVSQEKTANWLVQAGFMTACLMEALKNTPDEQSGRMYSRIFLHSLQSEVRQRVVEKGAEVLPKYVQDEYQKIEKWENENG